jgi:hemerythrin superfamily protein
MSTRKSSRQEETADAIELLTADHNEVDEMFETYQDLVDGDADSDAKATLAEQICDALTVHATIEEEIFYPAARLSLEEEDLLDEAEVEHASVKDLIAQIREMEPDEELYDAKVKVLGEYVKHHVEEEEGEMFQQLRDTDFDAEAIGERLLARKQELMAEAGMLEEEASEEEEA